MQIVLQRRILFFLFSTCQAHRGNNEDRQARKHTTGTRLPQHAPSSSNFFLSLLMLAEGCHGSGYLGRIGLFELMVVGEALADRISAQADLLELRRAARAAGMRSLLDDGIGKASEGITSLEEVLRVAVS